MGVEPLDLLLVGLEPLPGCPEGSWRSSFCPGAELRLWLAGTTRAVEAAAAVGVGELGWRSFAEAGVSLFIGD